MYSEEEMENMSFSDIKEAVVAKFCEGECKETYQQYLLGCCSASMIQDTGKKHFLSSMIRGNWQCIEGIFFIQVVEAHLVD